MNKATRVAVTAGLGLAGLAIVIGPVTAQQPADSAARRASTTPTPTARPAGMAPVIATIDMDAVFKGYEKVNQLSDEFKANATLKQQELIKIQQEMKTSAEAMQKLTPSGPDFKKYENRITELKASHEAKREQFEREFSQREADSLAILYEEIQRMVGWYAKRKGINYVIKASNQPINGAEPNSVMSAMSRTMVYADASNDITKDVISSLNTAYRQVANTSAKAPARSPAAGPAAAPSPAAPGAN